MNKDLRYPSRTTEAIHINKIKILCSKQESYLFVSTIL
nr:MAG TPA: hypothetical protein [Caudoviricetes sp.]